MATLLNRSSGVEVRGGGTGRRHHNPKMRKQQGLLLLLLMSGAASHTAAPPRLFLLGRDEGDAYGREEGKRAGSTSAMQSK